MNVLVTGASGFIASALIKKLKLRKINVTGVDLRANLVDDYFSIRLDVASKEFLDLKAGNWHYIYHLGSPCSVLQFNKNPTGCFKNTIDSFRNVLEIAEYSDAKLIYPSSGNVYGEALLPHSELTKTQPNNLYGFAKDYCEKLFKLSNASGVGFRIFTGYGPGEEKKGELSSVLYQFLRYMKKGISPVIWGDGTQQRDFIYIDDITKGLISPIFKYVPPVLNLGSGKGYSFNELIENINTVLNTDIRPTYLDKPQNYVDNAVADISLMEKCLNISPVPLLTGLEAFNKYLEKIV